MNKLSSEKVAEVLMDAASGLRKMAEERDHYKKVAEDLTRRDRAEKVASIMHSKGIELDTDPGVLADRLEKAAQQGRLDTIELAVDMVAPDMGTKMAQVSSAEERATLGSSSFEQYLLGDVG